MPTIEQIIEKLENEGHTTPEKAAVEQYQGKLHSFRTLMEQHPDAGSDTLQKAAHELDCQQRYFRLQWSNTLRADSRHLASMITLIDETAQQLECGQEFPGRDMFIIYTKDRLRDLREKQAGIRLPTQES